MAVVQKYRGDAVVIPAERAGVEWPTISTYPQRDMSPEIMGKGSSFALGVCLAQPGTKVIVFDGDGSLEMNLGTLVTIGEQQPRNLYHFVLENGMYATTGGQPIPRAGQSFIRGTGHGCGICCRLRFRRSRRILNPSRGDTKSVRSSNDMCKD